MFLDSNQHFLETETHSENEIDMSLCLTRSCLIGSRLTRAACSNSSSPYTEDSLGGENMKCNWKQALPVYLNLNMQTASECSLHVCWTSPSQTQSICTHPQLESADQLWWWRRATYQTSRIFVVDDLIFLYASCCLPQTHIQSSNQSWSECIISLHAIENASTVRFAQLTALVTNHNLSSVQSSA